jgi:tetratricopeptide (TPR) repeat protein
VLLSESRSEEAVSEIQKALEQRPIDATADLIYAYSLAGRKNEAKELLAGLERKSEKEYVPNVLLALANAAAGVSDRAIELLEKAAAERSNQLWVNLNEPHFRQLCSDLRFQKFLNLVSARTLR